MGACACGWLMVCEGWSGRWRACGRPYLTDSGSGALQSMSILVVDSYTRHPHRCCCYSPPSRPITVQLYCIRSIAAACYKSLRLLLTDRTRRDFFVQRERACTHKVQGKQEGDKHTRPATQLRRAAFTEKNPSGAEECSYDHVAWTCRQASMTVGAKVGG
jgi:hypothetical protein